MGDVEYSKSIDQLVGDFHSFRQPDSAKKHPKLLLPLEVPGFEQMHWTKVDESQKGLMTPTDAFVWCYKRNLTLQSVREAVVYRTDQQTDSTRKITFLPLVTRTHAFYFHDGEKLYVAFNDSENDDPIWNYLLQCDQWMKPDIKLSKDHRAVKNALHRAERNDRIVEAKQVYNVQGRGPHWENAVWPGELSTPPNESGESDFGSHPLSFALVGDFAERYAHFIEGTHQGKNHQPRHIEIRILTHPQSLSSDSVIVRTVKLGGFSGFYQIGATENHGTMGYVRGVIHS